jgi:hypothetical protein
MSEHHTPKMAWIRAGAALSLGALAFSMLGGRRAAARLSARVAGAFLEAWGDRRLENRVARLLARAEGADPALKAEAARPGIETLFAGRAGSAIEARTPRRESHRESGSSDATPPRQHPEPK